MNHGVERNSPFSEKCAFGKTALLIIRVSLICLWLFWVRNTDSYYSVYVLCAAAGIVCTIRNSLGPADPPGKGKLTVLFLSMCFSAAVVLANYRLFIVMPAAKRYFAAICCLMGGIAIAHPVLQFFADRIPFFFGRREPGLHPARFYITCFFCIEGIFLTYLLGAGYPAYFTPDVFNSFQQIIDGVYVNNNPFWYTISIKIIAGLGYQLFGNANAAIAFYVFLQGIFMAAVFSYVLVTLYQLGVQRWVIAVCGLIYLLPYNIVYSATMLKDIPFSTSCLLFVVSLYRVIRRIGGKQWLNYTCFVIGAFVFCLMRTNGWASFLITSIVVLCLLRKNHRRTFLLVIAVILVLTWILTSPLLTLWNVESTDFVEGLAVPFQQIARVITMGYELDPYDYELLSEIFDVELIPEIFMHESVDPIKGIAFRRDQKLYFKENLATYIRLWIRLGMKHPGEYLKAWIELTKGYWNGGYKYWIYFTGGENPDLGIIRPDTLPLREFFSGCFEAVEETVLIQPFYSIGLHVWILFACFAMNCIHRRIEQVLAIPGIVIILGLWLGTPVYSEFRYAYPMILSIPLLVCATLYHAEE